MGQDFSCSLCCHKCLAANTCCNCWCGIYNILCRKNYNKVKVQQQPNIYSKDQLLEDMKLWKTGDLIFQHYEGSIQTMAVTNSPWTHVAMVYNRNDNNILQQKCFFGSDSHLLCCEAITDVIDYNGKKHDDINQFITNDCQKWLHLLNDPMYYIGHRSLKKKPLTQENYQNLEKSIVNQLNNVKYGGLQCPDCGLCFAGCDFGCCYCSKSCEKQCEFYGDKCFYFCCCYMKKRYKPLVKDEKRIAVFCTEAIGILLYAAGIMNDDDVKERDPHDFTSKKKIWMFCPNGEDPYGDIKIYAK